MERRETHGLRALTAAFHRPGSSVVERYFCPLTTFSIIPSFQRSDSILPDCRLEQGVLPTSPHGRGGRQSGDAVHPAAMAAGTETHDSLSIFFRVGEWQAG